MIRMGCTPEPCRHKYATDAIANHFDRGRSSPGVADLSTAQGLDQFWREKGAERSTKVMLQTTSNIRCTTPRFTYGLKAV